MLPIPLSDTRVMTAKIAGMVAAMARPVTRGTLAPAHAYAALAAEVSRGTQTAEAFTYQLNLWIAILAQNIAAREVERDLVRHRILRAIKPMIGVHRLFSDVMAEAQGINAYAGLPLLDTEVTDLVRREVWFSLPPAPQGARHGR